MIAILATAYLSAGYVFAAQLTDYHFETIHLKRRQPSGVWIVERCGWVAAVVYMVLLTLGWLPLVVCALAWKPK